MRHTHSIIDHDKHFIIDPITRKIMPETPVKNRIAQYDHNSERFTFELPRFIEGHDMSMCDVVQIHYLNISSDKKNRKSGLYETSDIGLLENNNEKIFFSWLISRNATQLNGSLNFTIKLACVNDGDVEYSWHTAIYSGVAVTNGIDNSSIVVEEYADVLEEWRQKLFGEQEVLIAITLPTMEWVQSEDMTYYTQDLTLSDIPITEYTKIDLHPSSEQLITFMNHGVSMFVANDMGNIKIYSVGNKPIRDIVIQATVKEVKL